MRNQLVTATRATLRDAGFLAGVDAAVTETAKEGVDQFIDERRKHWQDTLTQPDGPEVWVARRDAFYVGYAVVNGSVEVVVNPRYADCAVGQILLQRAGVQTPVLTLS